MSTLYRIFFTNNLRKYVGKTSVAGLQITQHRGVKTRPKQGLHSYILTRYLDYIKNYEKVLEQRFPEAVKLYRIFSIGVKDFKQDLVLLYQIFKKVNNVGHKSLTRREMELYYQMPKDMAKVSPVLLLTALPFGGVAFPIAYMFPRTLLCSHFWSLQQRSEFAMLDHKKKLVYFRPVFRHLQNQLRLMKGHPLHKDWSHVLGLLGSGVHPSCMSLLHCKLLFEDGPFHLSRLYSSHLSSLLKLHNMHRGWRRRKRLTDRAILLQHLDSAIVREGGPSRLAQEDLRRACFLRGLNPINMRHEDQVEWLNQWLAVSKNVDKRSLSLLLHCPVLLGYNQPSNWSLLDDRARL